MTDFNNKFMNRKNIKARIFCNKNYINVIILNLDITQEKCKENLKHIHTGSHKFIRVINFVYLDFRVKHLIIIGANIKFASLSRSARFLITKQW